MSICLRDTAFAATSPADFRASIDSSRRGSSTAALSTSLLAACFILTTSA